MSLYNIDENKNMVLNALFAPYSNSPRNVTRITSSEAISLDVSDWIDVYGDYSLQGIDSYYINCYMVNIGIYLVIKHHNAGATNGIIDVADAFPTFLSTIYVDSLKSNNVLRLTAMAYNTNSTGSWRWDDYCYFRIIRIS